MLRSLKTLSIMVNKRHPVVDVYDQLRTARLNVRYFEADLKRLGKINFGIEVVLALAASSTFAGLWFWANAFGGMLWKIFSAIAAIIAILKPKINLTKIIQSKEVQLAGYRVLDHEFQKITILVNQRQRYDDELKKLFVDALDRKGELIKKDEQFKRDEKLVSRCYEQVLTELPETSFFVPKE